MDSLRSDIFTYDKCEDNVIYLPKHWNIPNGVWVKIEGLLQQAIQENYNPLENYKILCACIVQKIFIEIDRYFTTVEREKYLNKLPAFYPRVQEILKYLDREYAGEITSETLEKKFGGNFDYMNRIFKKVTEETIFQYLTKVRISHAKILMLHTSLRVREVGEKVGFPDEYYFSRVFKKCMGVPPATYAKLISVDDLLLSGSNMEKSD
jgi:YesN/AraC family two-component response regulator